jgi:hypothetical protein
MSDVANAPTDLTNNRELVADLSRFAEGVLTEQQVRRKWRHLDQSVWDAPDDALVNAVEAERIQRIRSGRAAREKAQNLAAQALDILGTIMTSEGNSPRHRIEAAKHLRTVADNGPEVAPPAATERFQIIINLGNDEILKFDKTITPQPRNTDNELLLTSKQEDDSNGHNTDDVENDRLPWGLLLASKRTEGGGGEPL